MDKQVIYYGKMFVYLTVFGAFIHFVILRLNWLQDSVGTYVMAIGILGLAIIMIVNFLDGIITMCKTEVQK